MLLPQIQAELLYFQPKEQGTEYAIHDGKAVCPNFNYHLGFRLSVTEPLCHDDWSLKAQYLHFHARSTDAALKESIEPTWAHPAFSEGLVSEAASRWRLHLGIFDLLLGKVFPTSWHLDLIPNFGLRFSGVRVKTRVNYPDDELSMKNKFWGIGPYFSLEMLWHLGCRWAIYAHGGSSLLAGQFYVHQDEDLKNGARLKLLDEFSLMCGISEGALGLQYQVGCLTLRGSYEIFLFNTQNQLIRFTSSRSPGHFVSDLGDLTLQGYSFAVGWQF